MKDLPVPEAFVLSQGKRVIGLDVLELKHAARQAPTYETIAGWIVARKIPSVLDVGCNVAALHLFLADAGYTGTYLGLDPNPYALERAIAPTKLGNLRSLPYADCAFEAVVAKDVIEHMESYLPLAEAFRVAKEMVIVATYLPWGKTEQIVLANKQYTNTYRYADILKLARQCDFDLTIEQIVMERDGHPNLVTLWQRRTAP